MQVQIDNSSVNSVLLDQEPTAPTSRLLIASFIRISADRNEISNSRILASETTLMPAIPGLASLMSMTFAPKIELRIDTKQTNPKYTGAICGLGCYNMEGGSIPIYPNSYLSCPCNYLKDMEIIFDVTIDDKDIHEINMIRHLMNLLLREKGREDLIPTRNQLRRFIISMLKKDRRKADEEIYPQESYIWNRIQPFINLPYNDSPTQLRDVFPPHSTMAEAESLTWDYPF